MPRIQIWCSEKDMMRIMGAFEDNCPFDPYPEKCGEDARCRECIEENVEFIITE